MQADLWANIKHTIIRVTEERRERRTWKIFKEIIAKTFQTWEKIESAKSRKYRESQTG